MSAVQRALLAVQATGVFKPAFGDDAVSSIVQQLTGDVLEGRLRDVASTLARLKVLLHKLGHPLLSLLVLSVAVKLLSVDAWEEDPEDSSSSDDEEHDSNAVVGARAPAAPTNPLVRAADRPAKKRTARRAHPPGRLPDAAMSMMRLSARGAQAGMRPPQMAEFLLTALNESGAGIRPMLEKHAATFGAQGVWELLQVRALMASDLSSAVPAGALPLRALRRVRPFAAARLLAPLLAQETNREFEQGTALTMVVSGERKRTAGGVFLKLAKSK